MIKNKGKIISAIVLVLALAAGFLGNMSVASAAPLNWSADTTVTINSNNYTILSGSTATSMVIGATTLTVTVSGGESFAIKSADKYLLTNNQNISSACSASDNTLTVPNMPNPIVIITPNATQTCTVTASGGGSQPTPNPTPTPTSTPTPAPAPTPTPVPTAPATPAAPSGVTLYRAAGDSKVYVIKDGKKQWIKTIQEFNSAGYKWTDVTVTTPATVASYPDAAVVAAEVKVVGTSRLRVRKSNTTKSGILGSVKRNEIFTVLEEKSGWYKIQTPSGIIGWISGAYATKK